MSKILLIFFVYFLSTFRSFSGIDDQLVKVTVKVNSIKITSYVRISTKENPNRFLIVRRN